MRIFATTMTGAIQPMGSNSWAARDRTMRIVRGPLSGSNERQLKKNSSLTGLHQIPNVLVDSSNLMFFCVVAGSSEIEPGKR